ncbi:Trehalose-6-P synthase/phosphatase complex subunit [Lobulomyces angularis]|nr:Trehalose-6-P synthase/phosphatase complex subunit [Lobulomyces angularis]
MLKYPTMEQRNFSDSLHSNNSFPSDTTRLNFGVGENDSSNANTNSFLLHDNSIGRSRLLVCSLFLPFTTSEKLTKKNYSPNQAQPSRDEAELPNSNKISQPNARHIISHRSSTLIVDAPTPKSDDFKQSKLGNIGLQNAILSTTKKSFDLDPIFIGTLGSGLDEFDDRWKFNASSLLLESTPSCVPVYVTDEELDGHYNQFCKQVLWKPFHYQLQDFPKNVLFEEIAWKHYVSVNQKFCDQIVNNYKQGDISKSNVVKLFINDFQIVWINDYHLMLVPLMVRQRIPQAVIGFFLHIPFPSSEIFRCIHVRKQILHGLLGADLIGFQTYSFMRHFLMTCTRLLSLESTPHGIQLEDSVVSVGIFPIGINLVALNEKRINPLVPDMITALKEKFAGKKILIGRDKNDYVKGVRQKMLAFEMFLTRYPEWLGKVVLIQVALSTTEANESNSHVAEVVSRINSKFGTIEYSPVCYLHQDIDFLNYLALLTVADACLITSLRDGMNLTSHEYIVCQEGKYGPLIISEFAGTYGNFGAALRVNPWDAGEVADAINEAFTMSYEDKLSRWTELYSYVSSNTAQNYVESFVRENQLVHEAIRHKATTSIPLLPLKVVRQAYLCNSGRRIFFLDHDGTIIQSGKSSTINATLDATSIRKNLSSTSLSSSNIARRNLSTASLNGLSNSSSGIMRSGSYGHLINMSSNASTFLHPTTLSVRELLLRLTADSRNIVYIVSGRKKSDLEEFMDIPMLGLSAENGGFMKYAGESQWEAMFDDLDMSWWKSVEEIFEYYTDRTPGSYIEHKELSLVWHYGLADLSFASWQAAECQNHIDQALASTYPIHAMKKKKSVEVSPRNLNKGLIIKRALEHHRWLGSSSKKNRGHRHSSYFGCSNYNTSNAQSGGDVNKSPKSRASFDASLVENPSQATFSTPKHYNNNSIQSPPLLTPSTGLEPINFIFAVGDDRTDEYMFEYLEKVEQKLKMIKVKSKSVGGGGKTPLVRRPSIGEGNSIHRHNSSSSTDSLPPGGPLNIINNNSVQNLGQESLQQHGYVNGASVVVEEHTTGSSTPPQQNSFNGTTSNPHSPLNSPLHSPLPSPSLSLDENPFFLGESASESGGVGNKRTLFTTTVGSKSSAARWFLPSIVEVLEFFGVLLYLESLEILKSIDEILFFPNKAYFSSFTQYYSLLSENAILKVSCLKLQILIQIYTYKTQDFSIPSKIRAELESMQEELKKKLNQLNLELEKYEGVGLEFENLVNSYSKIIKNIKILTNDIKMIM